MLRNLFQTLLFKIAWKPIDGKSPEHSWIDTKSLYCFDLARTYIKLQLALPKCEFRELLIDALENITLREQMEKELDLKMEAIKVEMGAWAADKAQAKNKQIAELENKFNKEKANKEYAKRKWDESFQRETALNKENKRLRDARTELTTQKADIEKNVLDLDEKRKVLLGQIAGLKDERDAGKHQCAELIAENRTLCAQVTGLEKKVLELDEERKFLLDQIKDLKGERDEAKLQSAAVTVEYNKVFDYVQDQNNSARYEQENPYGKVAVPKVQHLNI